jgi:hypothetical protein
VVALQDAESIDDPTVIRFNESRQKQPNFYELFQTGTPVALVLHSTWEKRFFFATFSLPLVSFSQQQKQHKKSIYLRTNLNPNDNNNNITIQL